MSAETAQANGHRPSSDVLGSLSALQQFQLSPAELQALAQQGYLQEDNRGGKQKYWRLRFRMHGKIRTIYLGRDQALVQAVAAELQALRSAARLRQEGQKLAKDCRRKLRQVKQRLAGPLGQLALHFHGDQLRRYRVSTNTHFPFTDKETFMESQPAEGADEVLDQGAGSTEPALSPPLDQIPLDQIPLDQIPLDPLPPDQLPTDQSPVVASVAGDAEVPPPACSPNNSAVDPYDAARRQKIAEYRDTSLMNSNPLIGLVACCNSDLFELQVDLRHKLRPLLSNAELSDDEQHTCRELTNTTLRVNKQITQYAQLELRMKKGDDPNASRWRAEAWREANESQNCAPGRPR